MSTNAENNCPRITQGDNWYFRKSILIFQYIWDGIYNNQYQCCCQLIIANKHTFVGGYILRGMIENVSTYTNTWSSVSFVDWLIAYECYLNWLVMWHLLHIEGLYGAQHKGITRNMIMILLWTPQRLLPPYAWCCIICSFLQCLMGEKKRGGVDLSATAMMDVAVHWCTCVIAQIFNLFVAIVYDRHSTSCIAIVRNAEFGRQI